MLILNFLFFVDNTHNDLRRFQNFLYGNLNKLEQYDNMYPKSNQPSFLLELKLISSTGLYQ